MPGALTINGRQLPSARLHGMASTVSSAGSCSVGLFRLFPGIAAARFFAPNVGSFGSLARFFLSLSLLFACFSRSCLLCLSSCFPYRRGLLRCRLDIPGLFRHSEILMVDVADIHT